MKHITYKFLCIIALSAISLGANAGWVVIVNPSNSAAISKQDVEQLYLAKAKSFSDGALAIALNHEEGTEIREAFDNQIVGKTPSQMKSYWAKLLFTGKAVPIKQMSSDQEVIELVTKNPSTIGYIDESSVTGSVKVIMSF